MNDKLHEALQCKLEIHKSRAMNTLAKAYASGTEQDKADALAYCKRYGVSKKQIEMAIEHGNNVKAGIDFPNWE